MVQIEINKSQAIRNFNLYLNRKFRIHHAHLYDDHEKTKVEFVKFYRHELAEWQGQLDDIKWPKFLIFLNQDELTAFELAWS